MGQAVSHLHSDQLEFKQQLRLNREKADTAGIASPTDLLSGSMKTAKRCTS